MKKLNKRILSLLLCFTMFVASGITAMADRVDSELDKPYLAFGADLTAEQKATVMGLLGVTEAELADYDVTTITNADEHKYLGSYLEASVIGTRALSSVLVRGKEAGYGIKVSTNNISYCTVGMYRNALITAGVEDADVIVAGPMSISGTAALVGVVKAYEAMTGEEVSEDSLDAATNELVVTGDLAKSVGDSDQIEELIALIKQLIAENDINSKEDIEEVIDKAADELEVNLTEEDRQLISDLMQKIADLDLDVDALKNQASDLYNKISDMDIDIDTEAATNLFIKIVNAVTNFFKNLFN